MKFNVELLKTTKLAVLDTNKELIYCTDMQVIIIEVGDVDYDGTGGIAMTGHVN